jgi:hypothetical protein
LSVPTYLFVVCVAAALIWGGYQVLTSGGHVQPKAPVPPLGPSVAGFSAWLLLRAFASGCTAMTGVEAVSNGITAFQDPGVKYARRTLTAIVLILALLLIGIAFLVQPYHIGAMSQERPGYQSLISQLVGAVSGRGWFYYTTMVSVLLVLALSANTSFAGFPRLCRLLADDGFLPHGFGDRGRRLVFSRGILTLAVFAAVLLLVFGGVTDRLIPLFAVGAFGAFTISQAGMVVHWMRTKGRGWKLSMAINAVGAVATAIALGIVLVTKFVEGAWITLILIPTAIVGFTRVRKHYDRVARETACTAPMDGSGIKPPIVVVPMSSVNTITQKALRYALSISPDVRAVCVTLNDEHGRDVLASWDTNVRLPLEQAKHKPPKLTLLHSPVRRVLTPLLKFVQDVSNENPCRTVVVAIPELVEAKWYEYLLHNQRGALLRARLYFQGARQIVVSTVPWYLRGEPTPCDE